MLRRRFPTPREAPRGAWKIRPASWAALYATLYRGEGMQSPRISLFCSLLSLPTRSSQIQLCVRQRRLKSYDPPTECWRERAERKRCMRSPLECFVCDCAGVGEIITYLHARLRECKLCDCDAVGCAACVWCTRLAFGNRAWNAVLRFATYSFIKTWWAVYKSKHLYLHERSTTKVYTLYKMIYSFLDYILFIRLKITPEMKVYVHK